MQQKTHRDQGVVEKRRSRHFYFLIEPYSGFKRPYKTRFWIVEFCEILRKCPSLCAFVLLLRSFPMAPKPFPPFLKRAFSSCPVAPTPIFQVRAFLHSSSSCARQRRALASSFHFSLLTRRQLETASLTLLPFLIFPCSCGAYARCGARLLILFMILFFSKRKVGTRNQCAVAPGKDAAGTRSERSE